MSLVFCTWCKTKIKRSLSYGCDKIALILQQCVSRNCIKRQQFAQLSFVTGYHVYKNERSSARASSTPIAVISVQTVSVKSKS